MTQPDRRAIVNLRRHYRAYVDGLTYVHPVRRYGVEIAAGILGTVYGLSALIYLRSFSSGTGIAIGLIVFAVMSAAAKSKSKDGRLQLASTGEPVWAALVQANSMLFQPGNIDLPCLVLFSFEPAGGHLDYMQRLAAGVFDLKETRQNDPDLRYVANLVTNERAYKYRRRILPISFTGGPIVYCADLIVVRSCLPTGYLTARILPCIAQPGEKGAIELLPWTIAGGQNRDNP